jgi:predicted N-acetyltransferase YhbS
MLNFTTTYRHSLDNNLVLKSLANQNDVDRLAAFNGQIFGQDVFEMTRSLILNHPPARPEYWLFIEDESSGQIVSSLALIPWQWRYEDVMLKAGEMGIVGTLEAYRNKGLIRTLDRRFKELLRRDDFDLTHIQGIPYFYRQFGYEYALPLNAAWEIELHNIPAPAVESPYQFRLASVDDIPVLTRLYDEAVGSLDISTVRETDIWRCIFEQPSGSALESEVWLMLDAAQQIVGYWRITEHGFGSGLHVSEASRLGNVTAIALLQHLKAAALERNKPNIRLDLPDNHDLVQVARGWGAHDMGSYAWQIHLVDVARLLRKLAPVLERRIAASLFARLSQKVNLNLYRETFELHFEGGKLLAVTNIGFQESGDIRIPPPLLTPLLLGYRSREELCKSHPDVAIWGQAQHLIDVLFPKMRGFIYSNY